MSHILLIIFIYPIHKYIIDIIYWQNHTVGLLPKSTKQSARERHSWKVCSGTGTHCSSCYNSRTLVNSAVFR